MSKVEHSPSRTTCRYTCFSAHSSHEEWFLGEFYLKNEYDEPLKALTNEIHKVASVY